MKRAKLPEKIRQIIAERANFKCEYCQIHEDDMFIGFEIDHIVAQKHGGSHEIQNLAYACPHCNQHKGTDLVTVVEKEYIRIFNPRKDDWNENFELNQGEILPKTKIGTATIKLLQMNQVDLLILRKLLSKIGRYPLK